MQNTDKKLKVRLVKYMTYIEIRLTIFVAIVVRFGYFFS